MDKIVSSKTEVEQGNLNPQISKCLEIFRNVLNLLNLLTKFDDKTLTP